VSRPVRPRLRPRPRRLRARRRPPPVGRPLRRSRGGPAHLRVGRRPRGTRGQPPSAGENRPGRRPRLSRGRPRPWRPGPDRL